MNKVHGFIKNNVFFVIVITLYLILLLINSKTTIDGLINSSYYIKEMLMIMPVMFVLTALLDTWIPTKTIMKYLGKDSKKTGVILAFLLGSVSAGPVYAAFPFCAMLHKKKASINNIVIILSSWAVIKIPMLLNEAKFLGLKFMILRWTLTIIAILIFSWITAKIVKDEDIIYGDINNESKGIIINKDMCMGCTICTKKYPELFSMQMKKAIVKEYKTFNNTKLNDAIDSCPVKAIKLNT